MRDNKEGHVKKKDDSNQDKALSSAGARFRVLPGGLSDDAPVERGIFLAAESTDTRLMGSVGVHLCKKFSSSYLHQFFLLEFEELGLEGFDEVVTDSEEVVTSYKDGLFGALGGHFVDITEEEAVYLIRSAAEQNDDLAEEFPDEYPSFSYLLVPAAAEEGKAGRRTGKSGRKEKKSLEDPADIFSLMGKICCPLRNDYELIHYYVMRSVAQDQWALLYLFGGQPIEPVFPVRHPATLYRNKVRPESLGLYTCESLIMDEDECFLMRSEISVAGRRIRSARRVALLPLSEWEASLNLRRPEYLIQSTSGADPDDFREFMYQCFSAITENPHEIGTLYMVFKPDNDHVKEPDYRLDNDILAHVLLLDSGELIVAAPRPDFASAVKTALRIQYEKTRGRDLDEEETERHYQLHEPILGSFLDSGFQRFDDYLDFIKRDPI